MPLPYGQYQYPNGTCDFWYRCRKRCRLIYFNMDSVRDWEETDANFALKESLRLDTEGMSITQKLDLMGSDQRVRRRDRLVLVECAFKRYEPHFNSDFDTIDYQDLVEIKDLTPKAKVVSFEEKKFVYKFMTSGCLQSTFEHEVENYRKLDGISGLPLLRAVVRKSQLNTGLLISYIDGPNLWKMVEEGPLKDELLLLDITKKIVHVAANLEAHDFYHEDLKCSNIIREKSSGEIYFIDLGGGRTEGMYREQRENWVAPAQAVDAVFTLGRTIWELWTGAIPRDSFRVDRVRNGKIRAIIEDCEEGRVRTIAELWYKYFQNNVVS
jgi:serine/threonine protein kinase